MPRLSKEFAPLNILENDCVEIPNTGQGQLGAVVATGFAEGRNKKINWLCILCLILAIGVGVIFVLFITLLVGVDKRSSRVEVEVEKSKRFAAEMNTTVEKLKVAVLEATLLTNETNCLSLLLQKLDGWYKAKNNLAYKVFTQKKSWNDASKYCEILDGRLAAVGLRNEAVRREITEKVLKPVRYYVWIGLDVLKGQWEWSDGEISSPENTDWAPGQPNNYGGNQDCALLRYDMNWTINDHMCADAFYYMCEV